jgi:large subunit ribosomal protein L10
MAHVAKWKFGEIEKITNILTSQQIVGIAEIGGIPAPQLQKMREKIRIKAQIRCAKNSLILRALDEAEKKVKGINELKMEIKGQAAIITTDMNPFKLFQEIKTTRTMAPAKGGETASKDIEIKMGETPFKPGPVVGELQKVGIPAAIQDGKVVIRTNKVVVPAGEKISPDLAKMLTRLEIFPIEIGMNLNAVFADGTIYKSNILDIDMGKFLIQIQQASSNAFSLALQTAWCTKSTITHLLTTAHRNAYSLALEQNIYTKETIKQLLSKAHTSMFSLSSHTKDALDNDLKKKLT